MRSLVPAAVLAASAFAAGCDTAPGPSLYDPIASGEYTAPAPDPVISGVAPDPGSPMIGPAYVAGLTTVTITGSNFKPSTDSTFVYVGGKPVTPISITPTQIRLRIPNQPGDNQAVHVTVLGATNFGRPPESFTIKSAFTRWAEIAAVNALYGVATDVTTQTGFVSMSESSRPLGIVRVQDGARDSVAVRTTFLWPELSYYDGQIYGVRGVQAIFRFVVPPPGASPTTTQQVWHNLGDNRISLRALDVDPEGTVWAGGLNTNPDASQRGFYRITQAKVVTRTPFDGEVTAIEKAGSKLYVAGIRAGTRGIWRYDVTGGVVSGETQLVAFTGSYAMLTPNALAVTAAGDVIVGTDYIAEPVLRVTPTGEISSLYPGLLEGTVTAMRWISDTQLLISGSIIRADPASVKTVVGDLFVAEAFTTAQH